MVVNKYVYLQLKCAQTIHFAFGHISDINMFFHLELNIQYTSLCFRFVYEGEVKYLKPAESLIHLERNTLTVSFTDIELYNQQLATSIQEEYYRCDVNFLYLIINEYYLFCYFKYNVGIGTGWWNDVNLILFVMLYLL